MESLEESYGKSRLFPNVSFVADTRKVKEGEEEKSLFSYLKDGLALKYAEKPLGEHFSSQKSGIGGIFSVSKGTVRSHVMPAFSKVFRLA